MARSPTHINWLTLFEVLLCGLDELKSNELETSLLESRDDLADEVALDTVGLVEEKRRVNWIKIEQRSC
jgi:hypothetical protein